MRSFNTVYFTLTTAQRRLKSYNKYINNNRVRRRRKEPVDLNKTFLAITDIKRLSDPIIATITLSIAIIIAVPAP